VNLRRSVLNLALPFVCFPGPAQAPATSEVKQTMAAEQQILELEKQWAGAIRRQDTGAMINFLGDGYFLAIGAQGEKLKIIPKTAWLETLKAYETRSFTFDDVHVRIYGETAVIVMLCSQQATVNGHDRSAQFVITDIWVKGKDGWRVAERHSSRPEPAMAARP